MSGTSRRLFFFFYPFFTVTRESLSLIRSLHEIGHFITRASEGPRLFIIQSQSMCACACVRVHVCVCMSMCACVCGAERARERGRERERQRRAGTRGARQTVAPSSGRSGKRGCLARRRALSGRGRGKGPRTVPCRAARRRQRQ